MFRKLRRLREKTRHIPPEAKEKIKEIYPIAGYIFLLFTFFVDYTSTLIPFQLFNAEWEFQTIGKIVNTVWAPFLGFSLIFFTREKISILEKRFLGLLSWLALLLGIIFITFIPLILGDAQRISNLLQSEFSRINEQQIVQVEQIEKRFKEATPQELENFFKLQGENEKTANLSMDKKIYAYLATVKSQRLTAYNTAKSQLLKQQSKLKKDSLWLTIGAFLGGVLLINVWHYANWTRKLL